ncbi:MAG TPA: hypothetical protein VGP28_11010 [Methylocella sp.]|nr:hypothetical protein [Methylocella sp.]
MPRGHPGTAAKPPVSVSDKEPGEKRKLKPRGKPFEPGNRNGGRPKGSPNKINRDLREAYLMAANLAGGKEGLIGYLKKQAELENPSAFMTGLSKLLPSMLEGNPDAPLIVERVYYTRDGEAD